MCTERVMSTAVIGMGHMGSRYAEFIARGQVPGMKLSAVTRIHEERLEQLKDILPQGLPIYHSADDLFLAVDEKELHLDGVIIVTPHYSHEDIAKKAFARGLHGYVISRQVFTAGRQEIWNLPGRTACSMDLFFTSGHSPYIKSSVRL